MLHLVIKITLNSLDGTAVFFNPMRFRCNLYLWRFKLLQKAELDALTVIHAMFYSSPALVVTISCVISVVVLTRRNRNVQQRELQQSRNRATVTILLFALLYGVCNVPLVTEFVVFAFGLITDNQQILNVLYKFDKHLHFQNAVTTLLPAANSAANPILYFWRMPALREYTMSGIRRMLGLNREVRRPALQQAERQPCNRVERNINIAQQLPASGHLETAM